MNLKERRFLGFFSVFFQRHFFRASPVRNPTFSFFLKKEMQKISNMRHSFFEKDILPPCSPLPLIKFVTPASKRIPVPLIDNEKLDCDESWVASS